MEIKNYENKFEYGNIRLFQMDNMEFMKQIPDNYYELAIVDPPYGIDADVKNSTNNKQTRKSATNSKKYGSQLWDSEIPSDEYFDELNRISKRQIIWGANYFGLIGGMIYWHKNVTMPTYSTGELAWVSWMNKIDFVDIAWHGMIQHDMKNKETRIHPTQKPVALYKWILDKYAKEGDKILDTHGGSMSISLACHDYKFSLDLCELDEDYFKAGVKRFQNHIKQLTLF
jgi:site-specific DNA-methyltransferase (adenine-specific)